MSAGLLAEGVTNPTKEQLEKSLDQVKEDSVHHISYCMH